MMKPDHDPLCNKLRNLRDTLCSGLVERDEPVRLALLAALTGEHLLLLGPPGTAKSLVARRLQLAFTESTYFERLLTRFTVPEELFGPLSIKGLEQDRYERLTEAYLPAASIAFLDEIFKANSAILNALLTLLNEREFDNGTQRVHTPLVAVVGASNEIPKAGELDALFDRFLLRLQVGPVTANAFPALLGLRGNISPVVPYALKLAAVERRTVQELADDVEIPQDVIALLCDLRDWCTAEEIQVSDRRWRKVAKLLQVAALTNGRDRVSVWDCWLLQHCLWNRPEDREKVHAWYAGRVGASAAMDPSRLTRIVAAWEGRLKADREGQSQMRDDQGRLLYNGPDGPTPQLRVQKRRGKEPLFLAPSEGYVESYGYRGAERIEDRTNGGKGYTRAELNALAVLSKSKRVPFEHWPEHDAYLADRSSWLMDGDLPAAMEPTRHKSVHVETCLREIDALRRDVDAYRATLLTHLASLEEEIRTHLWVPAEFVEPASASLRRTREEVETLLGRIGMLHKGFDLLPRELPLPLLPAADDVEAVVAATASPQENGGRDG